MYAREKTKRNLSVDDAAAMLQLLLASKQVCVCVPCLSVAHLCWSLLQITALSGVQCAVAQDFVTFLQVWRGFQSSYGSL